MKNKLQPILMLTLALSGSQLRAADGASVEDRLKRLESVVDGLKKENSTLKKQLGWDGTNALVLAKPGGTESKIKLGGYMQVQSHFGNASDVRFGPAPAYADRFVVRRARVNVAGTYAENFDWKLEGDFGNFDKASFSAQATDLYINWNRYDAANVKVGQFKAPYGYERLLSATKLLTIERSLPSDRLTENRQIGVAVWGNFLEKRLSYSVGAFNGNLQNNGFNDSEEFAYIGRVAGVPLQTTWRGQEVKWSVGVDGFTSDDASVKRENLSFTGNNFSGNRNAFGVDTQVKIGPFDLEAEYLRHHYHPSDRKPQMEFDTDGFYVRGAYFIVPKKWQAVVEYSTWDPNCGIRGNSTDVWTFGANYYIKGNDLKLMANYILGNPAGSPDQQGLFVAQLQLIF